ncbi:hypothetical protein ACRAKI_31565 [Saccharothrix isguenensis]
MLPAPSVVLTHLAATAIVVAAAAGFDQAVFRLAALASVLPRRIGPPPADEGRGAGSTA